LRSTFASDALAAGIGLHPLAPIMGTSVRMIERHYGVLLDRRDGEHRRALGCAGAERDRATQDAWRSPR
jgi:hypothetical protein